MDYPKSDSEARLNGGKFTDGDISANPLVPPSKNSADYQNMVFDELINVIKAGGLTPSDRSVTQLISAINRVIANAIANKSDDDHGHPIGDISGLQTALNGKANSSHSHTISHVSGLQTALDNKADNNHDHDVADIDRLHHYLTKLHQTAPRVLSRMAAVPSSGKAYLFKSVYSLGYDDRRLVASRISTGKYRFSLEYRDGPHQPWTPSSFNQVGYYSLIVSPSSDGDELIPSITRASNYIELVWETENSTDNDTAFSWQWVRTG